MWSGDSRRVFYVQLNENHRPSKLYRHRLGTPAEKDQLVYEEADPGFFLGVGLTQSRRFILIDSHDHETSEVRVLPADAPEVRPRLVAKREAGVEYAIEEARGVFYILTNADGAEDFKIVTAPVHSASGRAGWQDLVPHETGPADPRRDGVRQPSGPAGKAERPAAHRRAPALGRRSSMPSPSPRRPSRSGCRWL